MLIKVQDYRSAMCWRFPGTFDSIMQQRFLRDFAWSKNNSICVFNCFPYCIVEYLMNNRPSSPSSSDDNHHYPPTREIFFRVGQMWHCFTYETLQSTEATKSFSEWHKPTVTTFGKVECGIFYQSITIARNG